MIRFNPKSANLAVRPDVGGIDLTDPDARFAAMLQPRLWRADR